MANMDLKTRVDVWNHQERARHGPDRVLIYPSVYDGEIFRLDIRFSPNIHKISESEWGDFLAAINWVSWGNAVVTTTQTEFRQGVIIVALATCGTYQEEHIVSLLDYLAKELFNR